MTLAPARRRLGFAVALLCLALLAPATAAAQGGPVEGSFAVQNFFPALGPKNWLTVEGARVEGRLFYSVGMLVSYQRDPFVFYTVNDDDALLDGGRCPAGTAVCEPTSVVRDHIVGDVMATLTLVDRLQIGIDLPVTYLTGQGIDATNGSSTGSLSAVGLGDPRLQAKFRILGNSQGIALATSLAVTVPFADIVGQTRDAHLGSDIPTFVPKVILDFRKNRWEFGANVGGNVRYASARLFSTSVGSSLLWGLASGYELTPRYRVMAEMFGSATMSAQLDESPAEADIAVQARLSDIVVMVGGGTGIVRGVGSPAARAFVGATFSPQHGDRDHDGVEDRGDKCPREPEDEDGFIDDDGCPEEDNDADGFLDGVDRCPNEAEDVDENQDTDGCPEGDDDNDGVPDGYDSCRGEKEDMDGDRDEDGCPDNDADEDGVPDETDRCVHEPEDTDGYTDDDGCPEADNDNDGVPDETDECGELAEDQDGVQDEDGCPDDEDGDGVVDPDDLCPRRAGRPQFEGCGSAAEARQRRRDQ